MIRSKTNLHFNCNSTCTLLFINYFNCIKFAYIFFLFKFDQLLHISSLAQNMY